MESRHSYTILAQLVLSVACAIAMSGCATTWAISNLTEPQSDIDSAVLTHEPAESGSSWLRWKIWFGGAPLLEDQASGAFQWNRSNLCLSPHLLTIQNSKLVAIGTKPPVRLADLLSGHVIALPAERVHFDFALPDDACTFVVRLEQHQGPDRSNIIVVYARDGTRAATIFLPPQPRGSLKQWVTLLLAPTVDPIVTPVFTGIMIYEFRHLE